METKAKHRAVPRERGADRSDERELPASLGGLRLELEGLLSELVDRAHETLDTQNRLRGVLGASYKILGLLAWYDLLGTGDRR